MWGYLILDAFNFTVHVFQAEWKLRDKEVVLQHERQTLLQQQTAQEQRAQEIETLQLNYHIASLELARSVRVDPGKHVSSRTDNMVQTFW